MRRRKSKLSEDEQRYARAILRELDNAGIVLAPHVIDRMAEAVSNVSEKITYEYVEEGEEMLRERDEAFWEKKRSYESDT